MTRELATTTTAPPPGHDAFSNARSRRRRTSLARRVGLLGTAGLLSGLLAPVVAVPASATPPPAWKTFNLVGTGAEYNQFVSNIRNVRIHDGDIYFAEPASPRVTRIHDQVSSTFVSGLGQIGDIAWDSAGNAYLTSYDRHVVYRTDPSGANPVIFAGTLNSSGLNSAGKLNRPTSIAIDGNDNVYVASEQSNEVAKIDSLGLMTRWVGGGSGSSGLVSSGTPLANVLYRPTGLDVDTAGNLYIADSTNDRVMKVNAAGTAVSVFAGDTGNQATSAPGTFTSTTTDPIRSPLSIDVTANGDVLIGADGAAYRVESGTTTVDWISGTGTAGTTTVGATSKGNAIGALYGIAAYDGGVLVGDAATYIVRALALPPSTPTAVTPTPGAGQAAVSLTRGVTGGMPVRSYTITASSGGGSCNATTAAGCIVTGLTPGSSYTFTATQTTAAGTSVASTASAAATIPVTVPAVPTAVLATAGNATANLTWTAPVSNGGAAITGYTVTSSPAGGVCIPSGTSCAVTGLTNGTAYTFTVVATNSAGNSLASAASVAVTPTAPPAPSGGNSLLAQQITTAAPATLALTSRTAALGALASAGGKLTYSSSSAAVCTVDASGTVTALKAGTCTITITAAATSTHSAVAKNVDLIITADQGVTASLPQGPQRFAGPDRVSTSADIAAKVFTTPAPGTSRDVVIATAGSFADALAGSRLAGQVGGPLLLTNGNQLSNDAAAQVKRLVAAGGTVYVLGGDAAVSEAVAKATDDLVTGDSLVRLGGETRYETATKIAEATTKHAGDVGPIYLVTGKDFADGVSVSAYAQSTGGVVLLTDGDKMPAATAKYLAEHDPRGERAVAIGGPAKAAASEAGLSGAAGRAVVGVDRFDTSAKLATAMKTAAGTAPASSSTTSTTSTTAAATSPGTVASVGLAGGASWPDALSGSAAMAALGGPLLLTPTGSESVPASTASALSALTAQRVLVFGGTAVVTTGAFDKAGALLGR